MKTNTITLLVMLILYSASFSFCQTKNLTNIMLDTNISLQERIMQIKKSSNASNERIHKYINRLEWFTNYRFDSSGLLETYKKNITKELKRRYRNNNYRSFTQNGWTYAGAKEVLNTGGMGRASSVYISPNNPNYVLLGASTGGLWRTTNALSPNPTWECISDGKNVYGGIWDMAVDPSNSNIIYIITSSHSIALLDYGIVSYGIFKTTNGGNTWTDITGNISISVNKYLSAIEMDPSNSQNLIICTNSDIYRTINGGNTWTLEASTSDIEIHDIDYNPGNSLKIVVSGNIITGNVGIIKSTDGGDTWTGLPLPTSQSDIKRLQAEYEKHTPYDLYISHTKSKFDANNKLVYYRDIYIDKFNDSGWTFDCYYNNNNSFRTYETDGEFKILPNDDIIIGYVNLGIFRKSGTSLNLITQTGTSSHCDIRDITYYHYANGDILVLNVNDGGVNRFKITSTGTKVDFKDFTNGLQLGQLYSVATSNNDPYTLFIGLHDNGTDTKIKDIDWGNYNIGDGGTTYYDDNTGNIFSTRNATLYRNLNSVIKLPQLNSPVTQNLSNPNTFYTTITASNNYDGEILESIDGGNSFPNILKNNCFGNVFDIAMSKNNPDILYVSSFAPYSCWMYKRAGTTWTNLKSNIPIDNLPITDIEVHPDSANKIWIGYGRFKSISTGRVYYSTNWGNNWVAYGSSGLPDIPVNCLLYIKDLQTLFCGTDLGVYYLEDGSNVWALYGNTLPTTIVSDLKYNETSKELYAATFGRGLWKTAFDCADFTIPEQTPANYTWDNETKTIDYILKISQGQTLTIQNNCEIKFSPCAKIIVEPGGKLIVDNSVLTSVSERFWHGIIVRGDRNSPHDPNLQGVVEIKNNAVIENAIVGIENSDQWQYGGGIIYASNSTFRNCRKCVGFGSYPEYNNASYFQECVFECTGPLSDPAYNGEGTNQFVSLWQVYGVDFYGCTFRNGADYTTLDNGHRGAGIVSIEAGYDLMKTHIQTGYPCDHPDGTPNKFYDLDKAISCSESYTNNNLVTFRVRILENEFYNNSIGIDATNDFDLQLYGNTFKYCADQVDYDPYSIPAGTKLLSPIAISNDYSEQLNILENQINFANDCNIDIESNWAWSTYLNMFVGMYTANTNSTYNSSIYYNHQNKSNVVYTSQYLAGNNVNLQLSCNDYTGDAFYDWYMDVNSTLQDQALNNFDPRNTFSSSPCGGSGIPYNSFVNYSTTWPIYYKNVLINQSCIYNIYNYPTLTFIPACTLASYCDIYPEMNGGEGGGTPSEQAPPMKTGTSSHILHLIYAGNFTVAENEISQYISDSTLALFLETVKTIYADGRNYMLLNEAEKNIFNQLALDYDKAGYYSQNILTLFMGENFPHKPLNFQQPEESYKKAPENEVLLDTKPGLNIYPNPADNSFKVEYSLANEESQAKIQFINLEGKTVLEIAVGGKNGILEIKKSQLGKAGIYYCILHVNNDKEKVKKILIIE